MTPIERRGLNAVVSRLTGKWKSEAADLEKHSALGDLEVVRLAHAERFRKCAKELTKEINELLADWEEDK